ncbi:TPA: hypothetical protein QB373_001941 [Pasteurella multocida]|uniref:hypothetical protein n=1 Tax=Pasteurella multocida TaxID=747 RepID=UPI0018C8AB4F|nr:hypothetical protein [Pasteurella multocida]HDR1288093.1 hypothetical protein [Pasteurella multocida]
MDPPNSMPNLEVKRCNADARSIKPFGTSNLINQKTGAGINRFYSPGRNFKFSAEITF